MQTLAGQFYVNEKVFDGCLLDQHQLIDFVVGIGQAEVYFPRFHLSV